MNSKLALVLLGAVSAVAVTQAVSTFTAQTPRGTHLSVQSFEVILGGLKDGGTLASYRACGHEDREEFDGGMTRVAEPCWRGEASAKEISPLVETMLRQGAALHTP